MTRINIGSDRGKFANSKLRGFIAAEAGRRQGSESFFRFHEALESAVHEQLLELGDESTLIGAVQQAGLDVNRFREDWVDLQPAQTGRLSHLQAVEQWNVSGTPTLVFPNRRSFHLELSDKPSVEDVLETFRVLETLALQSPFIKQLERISGQLMA